MFGTCTAVLLLPLTSTEEQPIDLTAVDRRSRLFVAHPACFWAMLPCQRGGNLGKPDDLGSQQHHAYLYSLWTGVCTTLGFVHLHPGCSTSVLRPVRGVWGPACVLGSAAENSILMLYYDYCCKVAVSLTTE